MSAVSSAPTLPPRSRILGEGASLAENAWWLYLGAMAVLTGAYVLTHFTGPHWLNSGPIYNLIGGSTVVALVIGARNNAPQHRLPWYLLAVGQGLFLTSNILSYNYERLFGSVLPLPSIADPFHIAFYPFFVAGMLMLIRDRKENREQAGVIDALIVTLALATLLWVYLIAPYVDNQSLPILRRLTSVAYPMMDIVVLGVIARVAAGSYRREPAFVLLLAGTGVLLLSDAIYGWKLLGGGYNIAGIMASGWAIFFTLIGTAALHPSMRKLSAPAPAMDVRLTRARLALLTCASLTAPLVILVREALNEPINLYVLIGSAGLMFALVLARMAGIVRTNEQATGREEALRMAGETLVTASTREAIYAAALKAARSVLDAEVRPCLYLCEPASGELVPADGCEQERSEIAVLRRSDLPAPLARRGSKARMICLERPGGWIYVSPLFLGEELGGALCVFAHAPLKRDAQKSFATLSSEVALALHSATLTEQALQQRSESRLSALIKNASDVVCIVGGDTIVQYMSPSVERMFGHDPDGLIDSDLAELLQPEERQHLQAFISSIASQPPGEPVSGEFHVRHRDGHWCDVEALGTNLLGDEQIAGLVLNIRDISERKSFEAELEHQAFHDTLTGLPNRALLRNRVEHALASQRRNGLPVAVLFLDIDDFKNVNDSLGHAAGDDVLQEIGRRLEECMRPVDTAARLGGDEFAILVQEAESEMHSVDIAQRLMGALAAPMSLGGRSVSVAISIGIAFSDQGMVSPRDADELLRNADAAMYMAKESGKGQYRIFEPEMHALALARLELKSDLQRALEAGEFTLRYQPIMDLVRGDMAGMEALVRWEHPERGTVPPLEFVPLLEDTGLIVQVGHQVLRDACNWAAQMQKACPREPPLSMAVNVSVSQLQRPEFIKEVADVLEETEIEPSSLTLELTESVMMQDMELSLLRLNALRALGVKLAIDDFGTGYSSLNYVRQFPVDILKIDRSFLADSNPEVTELTAAIVQVARIFNLKAVAEGIESSGQLEQLQGISCDFGQGFHFAKPLTGAEVMKMAESQPVTQAV
jgi:diguanylate cyclase (GGDEF)-like protein/PAS domain S-box-containing protein